MAIATKLAHCIHNCIIIRYITRSTEQLADDNSGDKRAYIYIIFIVRGGTRKERVQCFTRIEAQHSYSCS